MKKIGTKLVIFIMITLAVAVSSSSLIIYLGMKNVIDESTLNQCKSSILALKDKIDKMGEDSKLISEALAKDEGLIKEVEAKSWTGVRSSLTEAIKFHGFNVNNITVTDEKGTVIARMHDDKKGDSVTNQSNVSDAILGKTTTVIAPGTVIKLAVRTGVPIKNSSGDIIGTISVSFAFDDPTFIDELKNITGNEYTIFLNDERINTTIINNGERAIGTKLDSKISKVLLEQKEPYFGETEILGNPYVTTYEPIITPSGETIGIMFSGMPIKEIVQKKSEMIIISLITLAVLSIIIIATMIIYTRKIITNPLIKMSAASEQLSQGNLNISVDFKSNDELGTLANSLRNTISTLKLYVMDISDNLDKMASGDMTIEVTQDYIGDFLPIKNSLIKISESLNHTLSSINAAAEQVNSGAEQVSLGAQSLSQGATEQASSIQELSASIVEVSSNAKDNANNVKLASEYVAEAADGVALSNEQMQHMLNAMTEINESSSEISKIIKVIDDIAFQTNILALNAAVEAARAGAAGKGFAVVADEVRNLASKSAVAAKQTTTLIDNSVQSVEKGTGIAEKTAKALEEVRVKAQMVNDIIMKIKGATDEQTNQLEQIATGVDQISAVVQTNSATAEESAAASEELSGQAEMLKREISQFKLDGTVNNSDDFTAYPEDNSFSHKDTFPINNAYYNPNEINLDGDKY